MIRLNPFLVHLSAPVLAGMATAWLSGDSKTFYRSIALPRFAPPAAVFGVVWTILYLLMGLASYLIYTDRKLSRGDRNSALTWFGVALLLNYLWSFLFFRFRFFTFAACWILVILAATFLCAAVFYRIRPAAGLLLAPTLAWLVFAAALNFSIAAIN